MAFSLIWTWQNSYHLRRLTTNVQFVRGKRVLVVSPAEVTRIRSSECDKWDHLKHIKMSLILGDERERIKDKAMVIYVINRENLAWLIDHYGKASL